MREVQLKWSPETIDFSDIGLITKVARKFEVVAHLEVTKTGVRQLVSIAFHEEMGPSDLGDIDYLDVEGPLNPYPIPEAGGEGYIVVWNRHPLSVAAINFDSLHVIPPYVIGEEGVQITIRGLPEGVSGFLKAARAMLPPDNVNVVDISEIEDTITQILTPKQLEVAVFAVQAGFYENPRKISKKELSELTEIPRSTLQEHLAKAEAALIEWAVKTHLSK
ncbi:MAG: helix-turn-helix domain-containing protein [Candidatus Thermoplasmatota archaeon]|nr:helix-turn-helix domain-containing protein [Candidatus Thermoplasmatota archaeon]